MNNINLDFIINISKLNAVLCKSLDGQLGGLSYTDFIVLNYLYEAPKNMLRRIDLANRIGLSASGVTRLLLPMEKIGLIEKVQNSQDARVSFVLLTDAGEEHFNNALVSINNFTQTNIPKNMEADIKKFTNVMGEIGGNIMWK